MQLPDRISNMFCRLKKLFGHTGFQVLDRIKQAAWLVAT